ncbi:MAG: hypothetical protein AUJ47_06615 [Candidatus Marinimicrobia bacterium CG1_02_48_14]|nr:MAG: hypothetical protein AUJ47_06615 [Candidatus Marinimicrobia bacterium CG1_02_48_14]
MQCQLVLDKYTAYCDYDLTVTEHSAIENHLMECQGCREAFEKLGSMVKKLNGLAELQVSTDFNERLLSKIAHLGSAETHTVWYKIPTVRTSGYAIAAGVALALIFSQWMNPSTTNPTLQTNSSLPVAGEISNNPTSQPVLAATDDSTSNLNDTLKMTEPTPNFPGQQLRLVNQTP